MFCPGCGIQTNDDLKFCRQCGANLHNVRDTLTSQSTRNKFDWTRTWWAGHLYSAEELERLRGDTPEEQRINEERRRLNEIKSGVITGLIGVGVMISFYFFFGAVANKAKDAADIVSKIWMLGIVPTLIGAGLLINGFFISRRLVALKEQLARAAAPATLAPAGEPPAALEAKTTDQLIAVAAPAANYSVTDDSTAHLLK
jgi:hypothetical protein